MSTARSQGSSAKYSTAKMYNYKVEVKPGDKPAEKNVAFVYIVLHGYVDDKPEQSEETKLDLNFDDTFNRGQDKKTFYIKQQRFDSVESIELRRDESDPNSFLKIDTITVSNDKTKAIVFPILRCLDPVYHRHFIPDDTSLPQADKEDASPALKAVPAHTPLLYASPALKAVPAHTPLLYGCAGSERPSTPIDTDLSPRQKELQRQRKKYQLEVKIPGLPPQCKTLPHDEKFSFDYKLRFFIEPTFSSWFWWLIYFPLEWLWGIWHRRKGTVDGYRQSIKLFEELPNCIFNRWKTDSAFGIQRLAGVNNTSLCCCTLDNFPKIDINKDEKWVRDEIAEKTLFFVDHSILKGVKKDYDVAPIALFSRKTGQLLPVAIQLFPNQPVFTPDDKYTWIMAKMWFNNADAQVHQSICHLGFTHLIMEGVAVVTHRQLAPAHPVFKLLAPHFLYLIAIDSEAVATLLSPNGYFATEMSIGVDGCAELIRRKRETWRMNVEGTLPEDLRDRGFDDQTPGYHFMEDGLELYTAIQNYVRNYLTIYYTDPTLIANDNELQAWRTEMTTPVTEGGLGINGVPGTDGQFTETEQIVTTLTSIIYTCSVGHAAANFKQYDEYAFPPNYPTKLNGHPPLAKDGLLEENDIVNALPDTSSVQKTLLLAKILSQQGTNGLGDFEVRYIFDPKAIPAIQSFRDQLKKIEDKIEARNKEREIPYLYLHPARVPNAISI